jgi:hypothetical protein
MDNIVDLNGDFKVEGAAWDPPQNTRTWKDFAALINGAWRKGAQAFIQAGQYLLEAKGELDRDNFGALVHFKLDFDSSVARKLIHVAENSRLCAHGHKLPSCWTTIYELSKLDDAVLEAKLGDDTINPKMQRKDAIALRRPPIEETENTAAEEARDSRANSSSPALVEAWQAASPTERREIIQSEDAADIVDLMSDAQRTALYDRLISLQIAQATAVAPSTSSKKLLTNLTGTFHWALGQEDAASGAQALKIIAAKLAVNKRSAKDIGFAFMKTGKH